jgi:hypothetical protein
MRFEDLNEAQRNALAALQAQHDAAAASLNARWAHELAEAERAGEESAGARFFLAGASEPDASGLGRASRARQELDAETEARLRELLDASQEDRLPAQQAEPEEPWIGDDEVIQIRRDS